MTKKILVVEDETLIRHLCADVFREAGYTVLEAEDADEALVILRSEQPVAAVVSDIRMPGTIDGLGLRCEVERNWPATKMLLTSGDTLLERSQLPQDQAFLPKPYRFLELVAEVETLMRVPGSRHAET